MLERWLGLFAVILVAGCATPSPMSVGPFPNDYKEIIQGKY